MRIYIFVGMYEGFPCEVEVYLDKMKAEHKFEKYTGFKFGSKKVQIEIEKKHTNWAGTDIFEREI